MTGGSTRQLIEAGQAIAEPLREHDGAPGYYAVVVDDPPGIRREVI